MSRRLGLALASLLSMTALSHAAELKVVASFSILGDLTKTVGGEHIALTTLVGPNGDAHVYQPTPTDAEAVAGADVVIVNGLGFEGFLSRLMEASGYKGPVVTAAAAVKPLSAEEEDAGHDREAHAEEAHTEEGHDHEAHAEAGHDHGSIDPHAWQDPGNARLYVAAIRDGLCAADAANCASYTANAASLDGEIAKLDTEAHAAFDAIPAEKRKVITSHDAFGYFGKAYGITFYAPQGISTESEASAGDVGALIRQIRESGVKTLFVETIADPRLIQQIASETGATMGGELYSDALAPAGEPAGTYLGMMDHNIKLLAAAMGSGS